jgi:hypothetical protein
MKVLLDECVPRKLKPMFVAAGHDCETAREAGYGGIAKFAETKFSVMRDFPRNSLPAAQPLHL